MLEGPQHNTLDAEWFGQIPWLSSLYLAALRAGEAMAREMGDEDFAASARAIADRGGRNDRTNGSGTATLLHPARRPGPPGRRSASYDGCHIDQVFGQSWAYQVGLGRILDPIT